MLQCADDDHPAGTTEEAGLPEIQGYASFGSGSGNGSGQALSREESSGPFYHEAAWQGDTWPTSWSKPGLAGKFYKNIGFKASKANAIYGNSDTVQMKSIYCNIWQRIE